MRTQDERIELLHKRAAEIERGRNRSRAACWGGESAGGYILAAVIAFFAGVIITVICYRKQHK